MDSPSTSDELYSLLAAKKDISGVLRRCKLVMDSVNKENLKKASLDDIIFLAENCTPTSYAPKGWLPGCPIGHPPAPRIEQMRSGLLGSLGVSLGINIISEQQSFSLSTSYADTGSATETKDMDMDVDVESEEDTNDITQNEPAVEVEEIPLAKGAGTAFNRFQHTSSSNNVKKSRVIDMNYGFSSDSSSDSDEEK